MLPLSTAQVKQNFVAETLVLRSTSCQVKQETYYWKHEAVLKLV